MAYMSADIMLELVMCIYEKLLIFLLSLSLYVMAAYCKWQKIVYQNIFIHFIHEKLLEG